MTTRNEPTVGNFMVTAANFAFGKAKVSHEAIANEALDLFTKAEEKMDSAIKQIDALVEQERKAIEEANTRIDAAAGSKDRLTRTLDRVRALTA